MLDAKLLPKDVRDAVAKNRGWDELPEAKQNEQIAMLSVDEALTSFFTWHGLIGWTPTIIRVVDQVRVCDLSVKA